MNVSGGLIYHWRHLRHSELWRPAREWLAAELQKWTPPEQELVLIGPGPGYLIPSEFLLRFPRVHRVDTDKMSHMMFFSRFPVVRGTISTKDYFSLDQPSRVGRALTELKGDFPSAAFLFCNVLGQLPVLLRENGKGPEAETFMADLARTLREEFKDRSWASFHDLYSWDEPVGALAGSKPIEMRDHLTGHLGHTSACVWQLTPRSRHQLGFVRKE